MKQSVFGRRLKPNVKGEAKITSFTFHWFVFYLIPYLIGLLVWSRRSAVIVGIVAFTWAAGIIAVVGFESDGVLMAVPLVAVGVACITTYIQLAPSLRRRDRRLLIAIPGGLLPFLFVVEQLSRTGRVPW